MPAPHQNYLGMQRRLHASQLFHKLVRIMIGASFVRTSFGNRFSALHHKFVAEDAIFSRRFRFNGVFALGIVWTAVKRPNLPRRSTIEPALHFGQATPVLARSSSSLLFWWTCISDNLNRPQNVRSVRRVQPTFRFYNRGKLHRFLSALEAHFRQSFSPPCSQEI